MTAATIEQTMARQTVSASEGWRPAWSPCVHQVSSQFRIISVIGKYVVTSTYASSPQHVGSIATLSGDRDYTTSDDDASSDRTLVRSSTYLFDVRMFGPKGHRVPKTDEGNPAYPGCTSPAFSAPFGGVNTATSAPSLFRPDLGGHTC